MRGVCTERLIRCWVLLAGLALPWPVAFLNAETVIVQPSSDTWIRQNSPTQVFEDDLVSVWSGKTGDRRHGLITFDLSSLAGKQIASVDLRLFVTAGGSQAGLPINQAVSIVPGVAAGATWSSYQAGQAPSAQLLEGLRHVAAARQGENSYIAGTPASAADVTKIQAIADAAGSLTLVLQAVEDGQSYKKDWGDLVDHPLLSINAHPAQLHVTLRQLPCEWNEAGLPGAVLGTSYSAGVASLAGCPAARFRAAGCPLPPGLSLSDAGVLSGVPARAGAYPFKVEWLQDGNVTDQREFWVYVTSPYSGNPDLDNDGDVDLEDFHAFSLQFTGPLPAVSSCEPTGQTVDDMVVLDAIEDSWVRESHPTTVYESDYLSVWSTPGDLRYGLVTFDVSSLAGRGPIGSVILQLYVQGSGSQAGYPISQVVSIVPGRAANATWTSYQAAQEPSAVPLQGLTHVLSAAEGVGSYALSTPATPSDRTAIQQAISAGGTLTFVLKPVVDASEYRKDWMDGAHGYPARLQVLFGSPCYIAAETLPDGQAGVPYQATLAAGSECTGNIQWGVVECSLPEGLVLDEATGLVHGTPRFAGTSRFRVRLRDGGAVQAAREANVTLTIKKSRADFDADGDVDGDDFQVLQSTMSGPQNPDTDLCWREYVRTCLDTLIAYGTDRYGPVQTAMLMAVIDVNTLTAPQSPPLYDDEIRTEGRPTHGRWSAGGSNLWLDMATVRAMYRMSQLTGDAKYSQAADAYIAAEFERAVKPNGLLYWGSHSYYNGYTDTYAGDGMHEILILHPEWGEMYRVNPAAVKREIDGIWEWHIVNKQTGQHNRHDDGNYGCDFAFSGGSFALAFSFMYSVTHDASYLDKARLVADWHWQHRDPVTQLVPDAPGVGGRYDSMYCFTSATGPHCSQLLRCYELTGDTHFRDIANTYIKAYDRYGWDTAAHNYWAMLGLDGVPFPDQPKGPGYDIFIPGGYVDVWRTIMFSYEFPVEAAETALYAYELSGTTPATRDPQLLAIARHWAEVIEKNLPPYLGRRWKAEIEAAMPTVKTAGGTYAENYGRTISFYVNLYHATGEIRYLRVARSTAREAIEKLFVNGLFKGHPAKPHYQSNDGVGLLLHALLQLDALPGQWRLAF
jgi:hypothetical protein